MVYYTRQSYSLLLSTSGVKKAQTVQLETFTFLYKVLPFQYIAQTFLLHVPVPPIRA
jgi:hypothetical protein